MTELNLKHLFLLNLPPFFILKKLYGHNNILSIFFVQQNSTLFLFLIVYYYFLLIILFMFSGTPVFWDTYQKQVEQLKNFLIFRKLNLFLVGVPENRCPRKHQKKSIVILFRNVII